MARVNMEFSIISDIRVKKLTKLLKINRAETYGRLFLLWMHCYEKTSDLVSETDIDLIVDDFDNFGKYLVESGMAERVKTKDGEMIRVKGADQRYQYLIDARKNGKKGGRPKKTESVIKNNPEVTQGEPTGFQNITQGEPRQNLPPPLPLPSPPPPLPPAPVPPPPQKKEEKKKKEELNLATDSNESAATPEIISPTKIVWEVYRNEFGYRYGIEPVRNAKVNGQIKKLVEYLGAEEAPRVVQFYLSHSDAFYVKNQHDIGLCLKDAMKLRTEMLTGNKSSWANAKEVEKRDQMAQTLAKIERGEI